MNDSKSKFKGMSKVVRAAFYRTESGNEPVRTWLWSLTNEDRNVIGYAISKVEFMWPLGMPLCRSLGDGLHEVRVNLKSNRIGRIFFFIDQELHMVIVHGMVKKTQKTSMTDLELARSNKRRYESREL